MLGDRANRDAVDAAFGNRAYRLQRCATRILDHGFAAVLTMRARAAHGLANFIGTEFIDEQDIDVGCERGIDLFEIGRAPCRERVCQYVSIYVVAVTLKKKSALRSSPIPVSQRIGASRSSTYLKKRTR